MLNQHLLKGLKPLGVPKGLKGTVIPFKFNSFEDLEKIVKKNSKDCAAIVLEPCRETLPSIKYLKELKRISKDSKCVLIFDEITSGFRVNTGGIHMKLGVYPDLAIFGKTIANGVPMGAVIGKKKIMQYAEKTFLSSAFWTEKTGPASAVEFIKKHKKLKLGKILEKKGNKIKDIWKRAAENANLEIEIKGINPLATFKLNTKTEWPTTITFFIQEMLAKKILASDRCYANYSHSDSKLKLYEKACFEVFKKISYLDKKKQIKKKLKNQVKTMDFGRLN